MKRSYSLLISIFLPFLVAGITYFSIHNTENLYSTILLPENLTLNGYAYVALWAIQYVFLGYASYLIHLANNEDTRKVLIVYGIQLLFLFLWPITLFNINDYLLTVVILFLSWGMSIIMVYTFYKIRALAGYIVIPYFLWVSYMLYYHFQIFILN